MNYAFIDHFQDVPREHFTFRGLERLYGEQAIPPNTMQSPLRRRLSAVFGECTSGKRVGPSPGLYVKRRAWLAAARHGEREAVLKAAGGVTDVNTVRRAVAALAFLDRLNAIDQESYSELKDSSCGVVELFARWWPINSTEAKAGLTKWKKGELTTRGLAASMSTSRPPTVATTNDESLPRTYADHVEPRLRHGIETLLGEAIIRSENKPPPHRPVHFRYSFRDSFGDRDREVAALVVGPYQNQTLYRKKRNDWMLKALGLANFVDWVFVVVPTQIAADDYRMWIERARSEIGADHVPYGAPVHPIARLEILVAQ